MIITTQLTEDYYKKSQPLFKSIARYWPKRFIPGFIDFDPKYDGEHYLMNSKDIYTFSEHYPSNRDYFVCPQGGEFIDYIDCDDDEVIIQIDADTIMQCEFPIVRMKPKENEIISVRGANPAPTLYEVAKNLNFKDLNELTDLNDIHEFTGSLLIARADTFKDLRDYIIQYWPFLLKHCDHHAGIQWLISLIGNKFFDIRIISSVFQCGIWYKEFDTEIKDGKLYYNDNLVIFNHDKFNNR